MENKYRTGIEEIVLETQVRANKAEFQLDIAKKALEYSSEQLRLYEEVYKQLNDLFKYIANVYDKLIENE